MPTDAGDERFVFQAFLQVDLWWSAMTLNRTWGASQAQDDLPEIDYKSDRRDPVIGYYIIYHCKCLLLNRNNTFLGRAKK